MSLLSTQFVFGEGYADRPVIPFLALYLASWLGFTLAAVAAIRTRRGPVPFILTIALLARLILLPSNLILENDCYRYVLDGEAVVHGVNPYVHTPQDAVENAPAAFRKRLASETAHIVLSRIGDPGVPTIYPPAAQGAFALGALLTPWNWMGQRIVFLLGDLGTIAVLLILLRKSGRPVAWIVLYAWNPLVLKEVVNSVHVDGLAAFWLVLAMAGLMKVQDPPGLRWACLSGCTMAGAILTKLYPIILVPICLAYAYQGERRKMLAAAFLGGLAVALAAAYVPFAGAGWEQLTAGLRIYLEEWRRNEGAFAILDWILPWPRAAAAGIALATSLTASFLVYRGPRTLDRLVASLQLTMLAWFLFLPAAYPWYTVALLAITALRPRPWAILLSGILGLYYLHFWIDYQELPPRWHTWVQVAEHGSIWAALAVSVWMGRTEFQAPSTSDMRIGWDRIH